CPLPRATAARRTSTASCCGAAFKFDRPSIQWIKDGTPKTMGAVADEWRRRQVTRGDGRREHVPVPIGAEIAAAPRELGGGVGSAGIGPEPGKYPETAAF